MQHEPVDATVIVVAGGGAPPVVSTPLTGTVIAADGGVDVALALGLEVELVVGDLDSASEQGLHAAEAAGARVVRHPAAKDATDLELACDEAMASGAQRLLVAGGEGGRLDHLLAAMLLLGAEKYATVEVDAVLGFAQLHLVRTQRELEGTVGELVSLIPLHGPAQGVVTMGLVYPLRGETLLPGSSRGVSNEFEGGKARISLERGVLLAVRPGHVP